MDKSYLFQPNKGKITVFTIWGAIHLAASSVNCLDHPENSKINLQVPSRNNKIITLNSLKNER